MTTFDVLKYSPLDILSNDIQNIPVTILGDWIEDLKEDCVNHLKYFNDFECVIDYLHSMEAFLSNEICIDTLDECAREFTKDILRNNKSTELEVQISNLIWRLNNIMALDNTLEIIKSCIYFRCNLIESLCYPKPIDFKKALNETQVEFTRWLKEDLENIE